MILDLPHKKPAETWSSLWGPGQTLWTMMIWNPWRPWTMEHSGETSNQLFFNPNWPKLRFSPLVYLVWFWPKIPLGVRTWRGPPSLTHVEVTDIELGQGSNTKHTLLMRSWPRTFFKRLNPVLFIEHCLSSEYDVLESGAIENNAPIAAVLEKISVPQLYVDYPCKTTPTTRSWNIKTQMNKALCVKKIDEKTIKRTCQQKAFDNVLSNHSFAVVLPPRSSYAKRSSGWAARGICLGFKSPLCCKCKGKSSD